MGLKNVKDIKRTYDSGFDDILNDFYLPVLSESVSYKRIAGFFSSSSLSITARGITKLIHNNGKIQLIVSPRLSEDDISIMEQALEEPEEIIARVMSNELENMDSFLKKKRVEALGWMIANGNMEIKVATVYDSHGKLMNWKEIEESGLFHIKVGILEDDSGNIITFSGSINETASAWKKNVEEFKVFKSWEPDQVGYLQDDVNKFNSYWEGKSNKVVISKLPDAVKNKILMQAPRKYEQEEINALEAAEIDEKKNENKYKLTFAPFSYQEDALEVWKKEKCSIFEMATGTGKTKTAQLCMAELLNSTSDPVAFFIVCPQDTLAKQWLADIQNSGLDNNNCVVADSSVRGWREELITGLLRITVENVTQKRALFVYTTFDTYCSQDFIDIITIYKDNAKYFIIGDEVHGLGSSARSKGLLDIYDYRLGLSATPERWYDEYGSNIINNYFGKERYEFDLQRALNERNEATGETFLTPYDYKPIFVTLTDYEISRYNELTKSITKKLHRAKTDEDVAAQVEQLRFLRSDIHKSAENKLLALETLLDDLKGDIENTLIFVSPTQIDKVMATLMEKGISAHRFTQAQGSKAEKKYGGKSEREHLIECFKEGDYKALVAIKCLDEGIDVPAAKRAIIMSSSTNPREYVQRIGRVIRRSPGKDKAEIFDMIVEPSSNKLSGELAVEEKKIFRKEMVRIEEISNNASNRTEIIEEVYKRL
ncbi:MAG: DEAD/DEAH box helicase family protein [Bacillota bacterium]|nr:DEAD/DEAH box helicase family protein [Bacillota bacterium]